jgi:serine/threonine protein kinase/tetratricopeptide (TPR) repeat protein
MEYCPVCMLRTGLAGGAESGEFSSEQAATPTPSQAPLRFENYEVLRREDGTPIELGRGAMGITYKAIDVGLRRVAALKIIGEKYLGDESARLRFLREARAAAKVRHANVASVFHLGRSSGEYFYAMEFVEGETLESLIQRSGRLEVKLALEIVSQAAAGLEAVHEQKLVHRDIKSTNIMVRLKDEGGVTAKIIDLGLAKGAGESGTESAISIPGAFAGTPEFASPEQFAGVQVDIRSDLYSLGVTLWEMLTGNAPFRGTPGEVMHQHQHAPVPLEQLADVPQPVVVLLEMLLEKDPAQRLQNPTDLLKVVPVVVQAVKVRRTIRRQNLRTAFVKKHSRGLQKLPAIRVSKRSIAVLPFDSLSDNKRDTYFADGVQDEILSNLAKVSQLKVISRTSVMTFRPGANRNLRSIAEALGVARIVEGTVRRSGNRVRITIRLIDARTDETLWSETYDGNLPDIFAIQSDIAQTVCSKLNVRLSTEQRKSIEKVPTENLEAYDFYLQAKGLFDNPPAVRVIDDHGTLLRATELLAEAIRKDSNFALAFCLLTRAHDELYRLDNDLRQRALGDAAVNEALRLRPDLANAHLQMAFHIYQCYRDYERARVHIAIAARTLPNNPVALACTAYIDRRLARWEESTKYLEKALHLDPRNAEFVKHLAVNYLRLRRNRDFERTYDKVFVLRPEEKPLLMLERAFLMLHAKADLKGFRDALGALPSSMKNDKRILSLRFLYSMWARDWTTADEILRENSNEELYFSEAEALIPCGCLQIWLARVQGHFPPTRADFLKARDQLFRKAEANPANPALLSALALVDASLGRAQEAIDEAQRAEEMLPISKDAWDGPNLAYNLAAVYALTNKTDLACGQLANLTHIHGGILYGQLKLDPAWDPLRNDPRFDNLLAELAPLEIGAIDGERRITRQKLKGTPRSTSRPATRSPAVRLGPKKISVARLPVTGSDLFGRDEDLAFLDDAWANNDANIVTIVAWAGVGKSTLVNHWLRRMAADHYRSAELIFGWSFYRQGTSGDTSSADEFLDAALTWFGDPDPRIGTGWEKGERLATLIANRRTLLVLDGLEPLQNPPGSQEGRVREPALQALLRELAVFNTGLCVITTRVPVADIADHERTSTLRRDLDQLSSEAGAKLLQALGVKGNEVDLQTASEEFNGHCLALTLLGSYLTDAYNGDIRCRNEVSGRLADDIRQGVHARKVMQSYQAWFGEGPELSMLRMLGLFDRPIEEEAVGALLKPPAIPGLSEPLTDLSPIELRSILSRLRRARLLAGEDPHHPEQLDVHPLVREYFGDQLRSQRTEAWNECNRRLFHYYQKLAPQLPNSFREMEPLLSAVICGCNAELYREALHQVYIPRIQRGDACFAGNVLGARGALLLALAHFFEYERWGSRVKMGAEGHSLTPEDQLFVLMQAALYLTALRGHASLEAHSCYERAESLCRSLNHPRLLYVALIGQWRHSLMADRLTATMEIAKRVYSLAQEQDDSAVMLGAYRALAGTLFYLGNFESARQYALSAIQIWRSGQVKSVVEDLDAPAVVCLCYEALCKWHLGETDSCHPPIAEAISLAKQLNDMHTLAGALHFSAYLAHYSCNPADVERSASDLIELSTRENFTLWLAAGAMLRGWARSALGDPSEGMAWIEKGIGDFRTTNSKVEPFLLALKAEALHLADRTSEALEAIKQAEKVVERSEERQWYAELQRLRGLFLATLGADETQIEASLREAIKIARAQKSVSLAKRAEATYAEYCCQKASGSGGRGFRLPLW